MIQAKVLSTTQLRNRTSRPFVEGLHRTICRVMCLLPGPVDQAAGIAAVWERVPHERTSSTRPLQHHLDPIAALDVGAANVDGEQAAVDIDQQSWGNNRQAAPDRTKSTALTVSVGALRPATRFCIRDQGSNPGSLLVAQVGVVGASPRLASGHRYRPSWSSKGHELCPGKVEISSQTRSEMPM